MRLFFCCKVLIFAFKMCKLTVIKSKKTKTSVKCYCGNSLPNKKKSIACRKLFYNYGVHNYLKSDGTYKRVIFRFLPNTRHRHKLYSAHPRADPTFLFRELAVQIDRNPLHLSQVSHFSDLL